MAKSERLELETIFYGHYLNNCDVIGQQSNRIRGKRKIRAITSFKVIQGHRGRYQSKVSMRLPINSNWRPISCRFGVIAAYCSNCGHCVSEPPFWLLRDNVRCSYSWAHWKAFDRQTDFLVVITELFSLGVTAEALRAKIDRKSAISLQRGQFDLIFRWKGLSPTNNFCTDS